MYWIVMTALMVMEPNCHCVRPATLGVEWMETGGDWAADCQGKVAGNKYFTGLMSLYCPNTDWITCDTWSAEWHTSGPWQYGTNPCGSFRIMKGCGPIKIKVGTGWKTLMVLVPGGEWETSESEWWLWEEGEIEDVRIRIDYRVGCGACTPWDCEQCPPADPVTYWDPQDGTITGGLVLDGLYQNNCGVTLGYALGGIPLACDCN